MRMESGHPVGPERIGNIYLQEVRNPNGVFNNSTTRVNRRSVPVRRESSV